jgi:hypothetical protein
VVKKGRKKSDERKKNYSTKMPEFRTIAKIENFERNLGPNGRLFGLGRTARGRLTGRVELNPKKVSAIEIF